MNSRKRNSFIQTIMWFVILAVVTIMFFSGDSILDWVNNRISKVISSILIGIGFIVHFYTLIVVPKKEPLDERSLSISEKATSVAFIVSMVYVFALSMYLYTSHEKASYVPVPWLWYIAYSTVLVSFITSNLCYFIIDNQDIGYED